MNELREKRKELGITQIQAAHACGVSRRTYQYYEEDGDSRVIDELLNALIKSEDEYLNSKKIKEKCSMIFQKYPEIKCAYLFGSYARGEATGKSDIDILVVCPPIGLKFYGIPGELEQELHKEIDITTHRHLINDPKFAEQVLIDGIKIYG